MTRLHTVFVVLVVSLLLGSGCNNATPNSPPAIATEACPVTLLPAQPFIPPSPYPPEPPGSHFWYGDESLWTALPLDGVWDYLPHNPTGYTQKLLWWRAGYVWTEEPKPALHVTGHRLDDPTISFPALPATNAFAPDIQSAMLVGVDFPTPGCWEITGRYADAELSYIVLIEP